MVSKKGCKGEEKEGGECRDTRAGRYLRWERLEDVSMLRRRKDPTKRERLKILEREESL